MGKDSLNDKPQDAVEKVATAIHNKWQDDVPLEFTEEWEDVFNKEYYRALAKAAIAAMGIGHETGLQPVPDKNAPIPTDTLIEKPQTVDEKALSEAERMVEALGWTHLAGSRRRMYIECYENHRTPLMPDSELQNKICGIVSQFGCQDIYNATDEILCAIHPYVKNVGNDVVRHIKDAIEWISESGWCTDKAKFERIGWHLKTALAYAENSSEVNQREMLDNDAENIAIRFMQKIVSQNGFTCKNNSDNPVEQLKNGIRDAVLFVRGQKRESVGRTYPELLTEDEKQTLLQKSVDLWNALEENKLGGFSSINRPYFIMHEFKEVIEKYGKRDVGLTWSSIDLQKARKNNTDIEGGN